MRRRGDRLLRLASDHPVGVLLLVLVVSVLAFASVLDIETGRPRLELDPSIESLLPEDDARSRYFERSKALFEGGQLILVALASDDAFVADRLDAVRRISDRIEMLDEVHHVSSLSTALNIRSESGNLVVEPFFDEVPQDASGLAELRRRALADPIYAGSLVSLDAKVLLVVVQLLDLPEQEIIASGIDGRVAAIAEEERGDAEAWITGDAHVKVGLTRMMMRDLTFVVPIAVVAMCIVAFLSFRTLRGVVLPLVTVGVSILWTLGWLATIYGTLNQVTVAAPPILLVVGFAYVIHILSAYYDVLRVGGVEDRDVVSAAIRSVAIPVFFTGVTTAVGFLSLMTSELGAIQQFGAFCGIGVTITMLLSLTLVPALLQLLPIPKRVRERPKSDRFDALLERLAHFDLRQRGAILAAWGVVGLLSLVGVSRIVVSTDMMSNFRTGTSVRTDFDHINDSLQGASEFEIVVEGGIPMAFQEPLNLRWVESLQQWLGEQPEIGGSTSIVDYVKVIHQGLQDGTPADFRVPDSRQAVSQLLVIGGNDELPRYVDFDYETARVSVRTRSMDSASIMALVERVEAFLATAPANLRTEVTGNSVLLSRTMNDLAFGQAKSLMTAFLVIYGILALLFTSFRIGFVALIPNAMPVLIYFGVLGWTGVTLNTSTAIVACLVLGIAVDDTIHLMAHFNSAAKKRADVKRGVVEALRSVGRPVTYTTAALCLGFLCILLSDSNSQREFAWLSALTLAIAWGVDVTLTPAIAGRLRVVTLWDVLTLDLGPDPHLSIPLFAGLRPAQARIAALLARIENHPKDHLLIRRGEPGDELYVVIDGQLAASVPTDAGELQLRDLRRGDVIGEVALFRGERSADVRALSDVRLLRLTMNDLDRLKRRYPRIGAQLFENLSHVLADRLASLTERVRER